MKWLCELRACIALAAASARAGRVGATGDTSPGAAGDTSPGAAVDSIVASLQGSRAVPGLSVAVARGERLLLSKGYGFADLERKIPAAPDTNYQIGSVSKQFTATAVMRLVERGVVGLDDSLAKYIPDYPTRNHTVLVRHLLQQTSGIKEFFTVRGFNEMESGTPEKYSRARLIDLFKREPFQFAPGERWAYSNSNYTLLGVVIERASGLTYEQYLQENFFRPLGLSATHSFGTRPTDERFAKGYVPKGGGFVVAPPVNPNTAVVG